MPSFLGSFCLNFGGSVNSKRKNVRIAFYFMDFATVFALRDVLDQNFNKRKKRVGVSYQVEIPCVRDHFPCRLKGQK